MTIINTVGGKPAKPIYVEAVEDTPSTLPHTYTPGEGFDYLSSVTVGADPNLTAENIRSGVNIFGVEGSYEGSGGTMDFASLFNPAGSYPLMNGYTTFTPYFQIQSPNAFSCDITEIEIPVDSLSNGYYSIGGSSCCMYNNGQFIVLTSMLVSNNDVFRVTITDEPETYKLRCQGLIPAGDYRFYGYPNYSSGRCALKAATSMEDVLTGVIHIPTDLDFNGFYECTIDYDESPIGKHIVVCGGPGDTPETATFDCFSFTALWKVN